MEDINEEKSTVVARRGGKIWTAQERRDGKVFMLKLIEKIYEHMQNKGVNFNYIAKRTCVSRPTISKMFSGNVVWTFSTLMKICNALDLDFEVVLTPRKLKL